MKTIWKVYQSVFVLTFVLLTMGCSKPEAEQETQEVIELKLGTKMAENYIESVAVKRFIELVEEKSTGNIKIVPYFGEVLGNSKIQLENTMSGSQDFYVESYTFFANYVPEFRVHSLPYLFGNNEQYQKFLLGPIQKAMEEDLKELNLRILNEKKNWLRGPFRVLASKKPVRSLDDVAGLKLRMPDSPVSIKTWTTLGANVSIIPFSETYLALQQGMVDGLTTTVTATVSNKLAEITKHITITHEYQQQMAIVMNEDRFQSLSDEYQKILIDSCNEAGELNTQLISQRGEEVVQELKEQYDANVYEIDLTPFIDKVAEVHVEFEEEGFLPAGLLERIKESVD